MNFSDLIREAIDARPGTRADLAKEAGVQQSMLSRFMAGKPMTTRNLDKILPLLGLKLVRTRKGH